MPLPPQVQPLAAFLAAEPAPHLTSVIALGNQDIPALQRLNLTQEAASSLRQIPARFLGALNNAVVRPYQIGYKPDEHELLSIDLGDSDRVRAIIELLRGLDNLPLFTADDSLLPHLRFYAFHLENQAGQRASFLRRASARMELHRRFPHFVIFGEDTYNRLEQKILVFDEAFDCFEWDGTVYIQSVAGFENVFGLLQELRNRASETVDQVLTRIRVKNADAFRAACMGQLQMIAKLESIRRKPYLATITMERIRTQIDSFGLAVLIENHNGEEHLVFDPHPERRWLILKLLDDDFLDSNMTDLRYATNSKVAI